MKPSRGRDALLPSYTTDKPPCGSMQPSPHSAPTKHKAVGTATHLKRVARAPPDGRGQHTLPNPEHEVSRPCLAEGLRYRARDETTVRPFAHLKRAMARPPAQGQHTLPILWPAQAMRSCHRTVRMHTSRAPTTTIGVGAGTTHLKRVVPT